MNRFETILKKHEVRMAWKARELIFWRRPKKCGAFARSTGNPCLRKALANGRCPNHGGLSTGPRTAEGKARALANLKQYKPPVQ